MNEIRRHRSESEEIAEISAIVGRHTLPSFVTGFDVTLGSFDDEPAVWVKFHLADNRSEADADRRARMEEYRALIDMVQRDLLSNDDRRFPYFRLVKVGSAAVT